MLIDYDLTKYDYRGFDLGVHFMNQMIKFDGKGNNIINKNDSHHSDEEKRTFLMIYQHEIKRLNFGMILMRMASIVSMIF